MDCSINYQVLVLQVLVVCDYDEGPETRLQTCPQEYQISTLFDGYGQPTLNPTWRDFELTFRCLLNHSNRPP